MQLTGIDRDDEPCGFGARIVLLQAVNSRLSFFYVLPADLDNVVSRGPLISDAASTGFLRSFSGKPHPVTCAARAIYGAKAENDFGRAERTGAVDTRCVGQEDHAFNVQGICAPGQAGLGPWSSQRLDHESSFGKT